MDQEMLPFELLQGWGATKPISEARPRITAMRAQGLGPKQIAHRLNVDGIVTPSGRGRWYPETVNRFEHPERWAAYMRDYRAKRRRTG